MTGLNRNLTAAVLAVFAAPLMTAVTPAVAQTATASGEVRRVDATQGKITIRHGAIAELDLPAMTLVYKIDPALLTGVGPGDKVTFTAARQEGLYIILKISK